MYIIFDSYVIKCKPDNMHKEICNETNVQWNVPKMS